MNLLSTAAQAFFVFASCCNPAASLSPQDMQSQPAQPATPAPTRAKA